MHRYVTGMKALIDVSAILFTKVLNKFQRKRILSTKYMQNVIQ